MSETKTDFVRIHFLAVLTVCTLFAGQLTADDAQTAKEILADHALRGGLCAHVGCGREDSAGLIAELAAGSRMLVHGVCWDDVALARAQAAIDAKKVAGQASVEKIAAGGLPYVPLLCNLIVVEDMKSLAERGVTREELLRVLAPGGLLCANEDGKWTRTIRPRPEGMDDWKHPHHAADGNLVSKDRLVRFPLGFRWIGGIPKSVNSFASVRGWVLASGRCYIVNSSVLENIDPAKKEKTHFLVCRDAFNGLPLWKIPLGTKEDGGGLHWRNVTPLAADDNRVYATAPGAVLIIDGATGDILHTIKTKYQPSRMLLLNGTLVVSTWEDRDWTLAPFERGGAAGTWVNTSDKCSLEAYDSETAKPLWKSDRPVHSMLADNGTLFTMTRDANPATENRLTAAELKTGKQSWQITHADLGKEPDLQLDLVGLGFVAVAKRGSEQLKVLDSKTGKLLWSAQYTSDRPSHWKRLTSYRFIMLVDGELWYSSKKYNPLTGEVLGELPETIPRIGATICVPPVVVNNLVTHSRRCTYMEFPDRLGSMKAPKKIMFHAARGSCIQGMVPANGMFYTGQNNCGCEPGQVSGFLAFGHNGHLPDEEVFAAARPVDRGPAFADAETNLENPDSWPMHRGNARRDLTTESATPESLQLIWRASVAEPSSGPLARCWQARVAPVVTPPVVAGGRVFAADTELGQVKAFDIASGKQLWTNTLGSRIDSAPTIIGNLCVVGSRDGWVYAFTVKDGKLAWRTRVAPVEQRMVVNGRVESTWPTVGSVLAHDGKLWANAGRGTEADGGVAVVQIDPATGKTLWAGVIPPGPRRRIDMLRLTTGTIVDKKAKDAAAEPFDTVACNETAIDPTFGIVQDRQIRAGGPRGIMLDGYLARFGMRGFGTSPNSVVITPEHTVSSETQPEGDIVVRIVAKAAGKKPNDEKDGKPPVMLKLDSAPIYDGLAVGEGRIFASLEDGTIVCLGRRE